MEGVYDYILLESETWKSSLLTWLLQLFQKYLKLPLKANKYISIIIQIMLKEDLMTSSVVSGIVKKVIDESFEKDLKVVENVDNLPSHILQTTFQSFSNGNTWTLGYDNIRIIMHR